MEGEDAEGGGYGRGAAFGVHAQRVHPSTVPVKHGGQSPCDNRVTRRKIEY